MTIKIRNNLGCKLILLTFLLLLEYIICNFITLIHVLIVELIEEPNLIDIGGAIKYVTLIYAYKYSISGYLLLYCFFYLKISKIAERNLKAFEISLMSILIFSLICIFLIIEVDGFAGVFLDLSFTDYMGNVLLYSFLSGILSPYMIFYMINKQITFTTKETK